MAFPTQLQPSFPPFYDILSFTYQTKNRTKMYGKSIEMMKVYGEMMSKVRLETNWGMSVDENPIDYKIPNF